MPQFHVFVSVVFSASKRINFSQIFFLLKNAIFSISALGVSIPTVFMGLSFSKILNAESALDCHVLIQ